MIDQNTVKALKTGGGGGGGGGEGGRGEGGLFKSLFSASGSARNVRVKDWSKMGDSRPKKRLCVWPPRIIPVSTSWVTELDFSFSSWKCQSHHKYFNFVKFLFKFNFFYINLHERIEGFIEISILATSNFAGTPQSIMSYQLIRLNSLATTLWCGK